MGWFYKNFMSAKCEFVNAHNTQQSPRLRHSNSKSSTVWGTMQSSQYRGGPFSIKKPWVNPVWPTWRQQSTVFAIREIEREGHSCNSSVRASTYAAPPSTFPSRRLSLPYEAWPHSQSKAGQWQDLQGLACVLPWPPHMPAHCPPPQHDQTPNKKGSPHSLMPLVQVHYGLPRWVGGKKLMLGGPQKHLLSLCRLQTATPIGLAILSNAFYNMHDGC